MQNQVAFVCFSHNKAQRALFMNGNYIAELDGDSQTAASLLDGVAASLAFMAHTDISCITIDEPDDFDSWDDLGSLLVEQGILVGPQCQSIVVQAIDEHAVIHQHHITAPVNATAQELATAMQGIKDLKQQPLLVEADNELHSVLPEQVASTQDYDLLFQRGSSVYLNAGLVVIKIRGAKDRVDVELYPQGREDGEPLAGLTYDQASGEIQ